MRRAKVDDNQATVVAELRQMGVSVTHLHAVHMGCPDILCGWRGANWLFEIKDGAKPPSARKLTGLQERWHLQWSGQAAVITSADEAMSIMQGSGA